MRGVDSAARNAFGHLDGKHSRRDVLNCAVAVFPQAHLAALLDLAARILETRALEGNPEVLARELLAGFHDVCLRTGLDNILEELALTDDPGMTEHPELRSALTTRLSNKAEFDPRGPRNAKPKQLVDCLLAVLGLTVTQEPDRTITLSDDVRKGVASALAGVIEVEFATPKIRDEIIARARAACDEKHLSAFDKIVVQLDERGMKILRQPKIPLDAVQAIQQLLADARFAVIERAGNAAIDRVKAVLAKTSKDAAERLDQPITLKLTPRQIAIQRAADARTSKVPAVVVQTFLDALTELARLAWRSQERPVREYAVSQTYAVGELVQHPKFGVGTVVAVAIQRVDVEFPEGKFTLVHARK